MQRAVDCGSRSPLNQKEISITIGSNHKACGQATSAWVFFLEAGRKTSAFVTRPWEIYAVAGR